MSQTRITQFCTLCCALLLCALSGCHLSRNAVVRTRDSFNRGVSQSAREELLLNLVRLKYHDSTSFLAIPSITEQLSAGAATGVNYTYSDVFETTGVTLGADVRETPTIVYSPLKDSEFVKRLVAPISIDTMAHLTWLGHDVGHVLRLVSQNINDVDNAQSAVGFTPAFAPEYHEFKVFADALSRLQQERLVEFIYLSTGREPLSPPISKANLTAEELIMATDRGLQLRESTDGQTVRLFSADQQETILRFAPEAVGTPEYEIILSIMNIAGGKDHYPLEGAPEGYLKDRGKVRDRFTVSRRSFIEVMAYLSHSVCVPQEHVAAGLVGITPGPDGQPFNWLDVVGDMMTICSSKKRPKDASVAVKYRDFWFYIPDTALASKSTFNLILGLYTYEVRGGAQAQAPLVTIGAGG